MKKSINLNEMSYDELVSMSSDIQKALNLKKVESIKNTLLECMNTYGVTKEELVAILNEDESINPTTTPEGEETPSLPEPKEEPKTTSVFDLPELKESYNPLTKKKRKKRETAPVPEKTPVDGDGKNLPSMESLLSDDPEYKEFYHPVTPEKSKRLLSFDELLSGEPIKKILCIGNEEPKGKAYRQNTRINHVGGIIPTETASGQTAIYIPAA